MIASTETTNIASRDYSAGDYFFYEGIIEPPFEFTEVGTITHSNTYVGGEYSLAYFKGALIFSDESYIFRSTDGGAAWTQVYEIDGNYDTDEDDIQGGHLVCNDNIILSVGEASCNYCYSTDGINWSSSTIGDSWSYIDQVIYVHDRFIAAPYGNSQTMLYSLDGINWLESTLSIPVSILRDATYGNGKYILSYYSDQDQRAHLLYSGDFETWTEVEFSFEISSLLAIAYGDNNFVCVAVIGTNTNEEFIHSSDGINWNRSNYSADNLVSSISAWNFGSLIYNDNKFVCRGDEHIYYSSDGISWSSSPKFSTKVGPNIEYIGNMFISTTNLWAYSIDGSNWNFCNPNYSFESTLGLYKNELVYGNGKFYGLLSFEKVSSTTQYKFVSFTTKTTTSEKKLMRSKNISASDLIIPNSNCFVATGDFNGTFYAIFNETPISEIRSSYESGKQVLMFNDHGTFMGTYYHDLGSEYSDYFYRVEWTKNSSSDPYNVWYYLYRYDTSSDSWIRSHSVELASINSPTFKGTPKAPTASSGTNSTQIATTAFVQAAVSSSGGTTIQYGNTDLTAGTSPLETGVFYAYYE